MKTKTAEFIKFFMMKKWILTKIIHLWLVMISVTSCTALIDSLDDSDNSSDNGWNDYHSFQWQCPPDVQATRTILSDFSDMTVLSSADESMGIDTQLFYHYMTIRTPYSSEESTYETSIEYRDIFWIKLTDGPWLAISIDELTPDNWNLEIDNQDVISGSVLVIAESTLTESDLQNYVSDLQTSTNNGELIDQALISNDDIVQINHSADIVVQKISDTQFTMTINLDPDDFYLYIETALLDDDLTISFSTVFSQFDEAITFTDYSLYGDGDNACPGYEDNSYPLCFNVYNSSENTVETIDGEDYEAADELFYDYCGMQLDGENVYSIIK